MSQMGLVFVSCFCFVSTRRGEGGCVAHPQVTEALESQLEVEGARASAREEQSATDELGKYGTEALSRKYTANARRERLLPWRRGLGAGAAEALTVNKCIENEPRRDAEPGRGSGSHGNPGPLLSHLRLGLLQRQAETRRPAGTGQPPLPSRPFSEPRVVSPLFGKEAEARETQRGSPTH